ncbi:hypothetical protein [Candidatus Uabimicrobium amorphum]|uniref:Uncharacterized protein n=1 Tax=Uabimicrobium amorphum TaxID=2596890 RepID=A0A5S9ILT7_UABAM|nr:hypothetical protein [Candidatus Uabimicrobium amorphum]BBM84084.1 hypothetical protein UABAM_02440 [Candidatus Uabimicrobium amorphum]
MNFSTILLYLFGNREAIHKVASAKFSLLIGAIFVLMTGVGRNYDQASFFHEPIYLLSPFIFSTLNSFFIFLFVRRELAEGYTFFKEYLRFLNLFWMTAPIAWLYAIPVETMMTEYNSAMANIALLTIVSLWRVCLMIRVVQVLLDTPIRNSIIVILMPVSFVVGIATFFSSLGMSLARNMGGLRFSLEEQMVYKLTNTTCVLSIIAFLGCAIAKTAMERKKTHTFPQAMPSSYPLFTVIIFAVFWGWVAIVHQHKVHRSLELEKIVKHDDDIIYALSIMRKHQRSDFSAVRKIPPTLYGKYFLFGYFAQLNKIFQNLQETDPQWMHDTYYNYLTNCFTLRSFNSARDDKDVQIFSSLGQTLQKTPRGQKWIANNKERIYGFIFYHNSSVNDLNEESFGLTPINDELKRLEYSAKWRKQK